MKKTWKKILTLALSLVMVVSFMPVTTQAKAVYQSNDIPSKLTLTRYPAKVTSGYSGSNLNKQIIAVIDGKKVTKLQSSDTSVIKATKSKSGSTTIIYATTKKAGSSQVSFKVDGKKYSVDVTVKKYTNPISSLTLGSKKVKSSKFDSSVICSLRYKTYKNMKLKVKVNLKSGWELDDNTFWYWRQGWYKDATKKNGKSVTVKGGKGFFMSFYVTNTKTGQEETVFIQFN